MTNHEHVKKRPTYFTIMDKDILWFIPLGSKVEKYQTIKDKKIKKYRSCNTVFIRIILDKESAILFQNAFPILEKYIDHVHTYHGVPAKVGSILKDETINNFKYLLKLHNRGINVFFADIDRIKKIIIEEIDKN